MSNDRTHYYGSNSAVYLLHLCHFSRLFVLSQLARVAGPVLIAFGIDRALPALTAGDSLPLLLTGVAYLAAAVATAAPPLQSRPRRSGPVRGRGSRSTTIA